MLENTLVFGNPAKTLALVFEILLPHFWLRSVYSIFKLTMKTPIDQSAGIVRENNLITTSSRHGKLRIITSMENPTMEALGRHTQMA